MPADEALAQPVIVVMAKQPVVGKTELPSETMNEPANERTFRPNKREKTD